MTLSIVDFLFFAGLFLVVGALIGLAASPELFIWLTERRRFQHEEYMENLKQETRRQALMFENTQWTVKEERHDA